MASPVTITTSSGADGVAPAVDGTWATVRNASTGSTGQAYIENYLDGANYKIGRKFTFFDLTTTNIPADATITAITFVHPVAANVAVADAGVAVHLTAHTADDPVVGGAFDDITLNSPTSFGNCAFNSLSTSVATNITVNAAGITAANAAKGGVWKLCLRGSRDIDNAAPTGVNQYSFTTDNCQIIVTYTVPTSGFLAML
jgi:hypothetical protein